MATEQAEVPEGFQRADAPDTEQDDDFDTEWCDKPGLGQILQGTLLAANEDRGEHGTTVLEVKLTQPYADFDEGDLVCFWSSNGIDSALEANGVSRGDELCLTTEDTFEVDGETRNNYSVYVGEN